MASQLGGLLAICQLFLGFIVGYYSRKINIYETVNRYNRYSTLKNQNFLAKASPINRVAPIEKSSEESKALLPNDEDQPIGNIYAKKGKNLNSVLWFIF